MSRLVVFLFVVVLASATCPAFVNSAAPSIAPIQSHPHGRTYGEWAAAWWQWALGTPASVNPVLDETGENCAEGQSDRVWFLAGTFGGGEVHRSCTVPTGTALFFPLITNFYGAFLNDPPETRTEQFVREIVSCQSAAVSAEINGVAVQNPLQYFEQSPLFDVQLPENNVLGLGEDAIPQLLLSPSVDAGYYLFLRPLPPGEYNIHWEASLLSCPGGDFFQNVTYDITVQQPSRRVR
jgi:hypothetical protein